MPFDVTIDLTGKRFGKLLVLSDSGYRTSSGGIKWICHCDCGKQKTISSSHLRSGDTRSCGCMKMHDTIKRMVGKRFDRLTVLYDSGDRGPDGSINWMCQCDCGKQKAISSNRLRMGTTRSCGCLSLEMLPDKRKRIKNRIKSNLVGKRFGRLLCLEITDKRRTQSVVWKCQCDCGNICYPTSRTLLGGLTKSCGCLWREKMTGANHYRWRGGYSMKDYGEEWDKNLKERIRNRDNRRCQYPDCEYDDTKNDRKLHVHHIDGNKKRCEEGNLISLCNSHHASVESNGADRWQDYFSALIADYR